MSYSCCIRKLVKHRPLSSFQQQTGGDNDIPLSVARRPFDLVLMRAWVSIMVVAVRRTSSPVNAPMDVPACPELNSRFRKFISIYSQPARSIQPGHLSARG